MFRPVLAAAILVISLASAALAERRVALVLATENYANLRPLANPVNDARAVEEMLQGLGFEVWTETDRDLRRMRRALEDFREDGAGADVALVFYAGHGVAIEGVNYLLPTDAEAKTAEGLIGSSLPLSEVQAVLAEISDTAIFLLDACRDDPFAGQGQADPEGRGAVALADDPPEAAKAHPGLGRIGRADGILFAFAAAPGETASDGTGKNSPFTSALLRHFGTKGVEMRSALTLVQQDVYDRSRGKQLPYIESGLPKLLWISDAGDLPERDVLLMAMADLSPELRAEVEAIAAANDMPLAPLYRAMVSGNLAQVSGEERQKKLEEAARSYAAFRSELVKYSSDDPRVAPLRARAEEQLALGLNEAARALLTEAAEIDAKARGAIGGDLEAIRNNYVRRTLSEASTHMLNANAARTDLRYDLAISDLTRAAELYTEIRADLPDRESRLAYAVAMGDLGDLYLVAGNSFGALGILSSKVDYLQELIRAEPGDAGWKQEMVAALKAHGEVMTQQGYLREAEEAYKRALEINFELSKLRPGDEDLMREYAVLSNDQGGIRYMLADYQGALLSHSDALQIGMILLDLAPDNVTYLRDIAYSQQRIGDAQAAMGDRVQAREAFDVSLEVSQGLVNRFPEDDPLRRDLSVAYERLGDMMAAETDYDSALAIFNESLKIREELQQRDPANVTRQRDVAVTWDRLGDTYRAMGDIGTALMAYQHALGMREVLAALDPQNAIWSQDLATSWDRVGALHLQEGDFTGALEAFGHGLEIRESLVSLDPASLPRQRDLSLSLENQARTQARAGLTAEALALFDQSLTIRRALVAASPDVLLWRRDLAGVLVAIGDLRLTSGDAAGAQPWFEEAILLREVAVSEAPQDHSTLRDLGQVLMLQVEVLIRIGDPPAAVALAARAVTLTDQIAGMRPRDPLVPYERMMAARRLAEARRAAGELEEAKVALRSASTYAYAISSADPWNVAAARDYAYALEMLADALLASDDYAGAQKEFEEALALRKWVTGQQPGSIADQRALAYVLRSLADSWYFRNELDQGRPLEAQALAIMRWIAGTEKDNAFNMIDLADSLYRSSFYYRDGSVLLQEAISVLEALEAEGRMPDGPWRDRIAVYRDRLGMP